MDSIVNVLTQNIFPIFVVAGFGFGARRWLKLEKRALSTAVLNVFSPCLVFSSLVSSQLPAEELGELVLFALLNIGGMGVLAFLLSRLLRLSRSQTVMLLIVVMFVNGGNYGLTLNRLRYGDAGLARAVVYYTTSTLIIYTGGMLLASMGRVSLRASAGRLLRLPAMYAAVSAVLVYSFNIQLPAPLLRGIEVAGNGAIPVMLLVLGMQMADMVHFESLKLAVAAVLLRLLGGPVMGFLVAGQLGLQGLSRSTSIVEASMPTAVFVIILATEFDLHPTAVTGIVVLSTILSPITVATAITLFGL